MTGAGRGPRPQAVLFWSSGKDAAYALHEVRRQGALEITALLTTVSEDHGRIAVHDLAPALLEHQVALTGLPLVRVLLPQPCPNAEYEARLAAALRPLQDAGVGHAVFGDLHLADIRAYRERQCAALGLSAAFPLWGRDSARLAEAMLDDGVEAVLTCIDPAKLSSDFAGRRFDRALLEALPAGVDACGENGEFHTFCTAGPMLAGTVAVDAGSPRPGAHYVHAELRARPGDAAG